MPNNVATSQLAQAPYKPGITGWNITKGNSGKGLPVMSGSSSGVMNQSFGFGPLHVQKAKYSSQEKMPKDLNADFSFDQYGMPDENMLPKI